MDQSKRNTAWYKVLADMEKAVYNVKVDNQLDGSHAEIFLKQIQDDIETILNLHYQKLNTEQKFAELKERYTKLKEKGVRER